ncbi:MAG: hypothetical protein ACUVRP_01325 [Chlorobiales bacterium]
MNEVFSYPVTQSEFLLENYYILTWTGGMLVLGAAWAIFFRFGNFKYGIDLGCLFKTLIIMTATMLSIGIPNYLNVKYYAQHGHEGDKITLTNDRITYQYRSGESKSFLLSEVKKFYKESMTFNPPPVYFVVAIIDSIKVDSFAVREDLPRFESLKTALNNAIGDKPL